jgi:hypothetical protein
MFPNDPHKRTLFFSLVNTKSFHFYIQNGNKEFPPWKQKVSTLEISPIDNQQLLGI